MLSVHQGAPGPKTSSEDADALPRDYWEPCAFEVSWPILIRLANDAADRWRQAKALTRIAADARTRREAEGDFEPAESEELERVVGVAVRLENQAEESLVTALRAVAHGRAEPAGPFTVALGDSLFTVATEGPDAHEAGRVIVIEVTTCLIADTNGVGVDGWEPDPS